MKNLLTKVFCALYLCAIFFINCECFGMKNKNSVDQAGSKAANLAFLQKAEVLPVPKWGALPVSFFNASIAGNAQLVKDINFINDLLLSESTPVEQVFAAAKKIRANVINIKFSEDELGLIQSIYDEVSDFGKYPVSVRSSATKEDLPGMSFAGLYDSFLNQKDFIGVKSSVAKCMASLFNDRALQYYKNNNLSIKDSSMGVIIQRMVNVSSSGTAFSADVSSGAPCVQITVTYGYEGVVSGESNADSFVVSPDNFSVIKLTVGEKKSFFEASATGGLVAKNVSKELHNKPSISLEQAKQIAQAITKLKTLYAKVYVGDIDTEFAIDKTGLIYILQIRPLFASSKKTITDVSPDVDLDKVKIIATGAHSVLGVSNGKIKIVDHFSDLVSRRIKINADDIVVATRTENEWTQFFVDFSGIVSMEGNPSSHPMLIAREKGVPCLVGVPNAVASLRPYDGMDVTLDGTRHVMYLGKLPLVEKPLKEVGALFKTVKPKVIPDNDFVLHELRIKGRLLEDEAGAWLRPILYKLSPMLLKIHENGIKSDEFVLNKIGCSECITFQRNVRSIGGQLYTKWQYTPEEQIHMFDALSAHNCDTFLKQKDDCLKNYLKVCENFSCTPAQMHLFKNAAESLVAYMDLSYALRAYAAHKTFELGHKAFIPVFFLEEFWHHVQSSMRDEDASMKEAAAEIAIMTSGFTSIEEIKLKAPSVFAKIVEFSRNYKLDNTEDWPAENQLSEAFKIIREYSGYKNNFIVVNKNEAPLYFPENPELSDWARLSVVLKGSQNSAHHIRVRGLWMVRDKLVAFGKILVDSGVIKNKEDVLGMEFDRLVDLMSKYNAHAEL